MQRIRPLLGMAVAGAFVYLVVRRLEWDAIAATLRAARPGPLALGLMLLAAGFGVRIVRWWLMLRAFVPDLPVGRCTRPFLASLAVNNTVPLRAGDVLRTFGFRDALRSPPMRVLGTLVIERVLDLAVLLLIFFVGLVGAPAGVVPRGFIAAAAAAGTIALCGLAALVLAPQWLQRMLDRVLARGPLARRAAGWAGQFVAVFAVLRSPRRTLGLVALSLLAWGLEGSMYASVAWSLGFAASPAAPWFALATGTLATLIPSSPGYVGTFDYFAMLGMTTYGAAAAMAAAFALVVHFLLWLPVTVVGALLLAAPRTRSAWRRAAQITEAT